MFNFFKYLCIFTSPNNRKVAFWKAHNGGSSRFIIKQCQLPEALPLIKPNHLYKPLHPLVLLNHLKFGHLLLVQIHMFINIKLEFQPSLFKVLFKDQLVLFVSNHPIVQKHFLIHLFLFPLGHVNPCPGQTEGVILDNQFLIFFIWDSHLVLDLHGWVTLLF